MEGKIVSTPFLKHLSCSLLATCVIICGGLFSATVQAQAPEETIEAAQTAYDQSRYDVSMNIADRLLKTNPQNDRAMFLRASSRVELGIDSGNPAMVRDGVADARSAIELSQSKYPEYYLPYLFGMTNLALLEDREEHTQTAITVATQVIDKLPMTPSDKANMLYQRGLAKLQLDDSIDGGLADFKAALAAEPKHMASLTAMADAYAMTEQNELALQAYNQFIQVYPEHPIGYNNRGMFNKQIDNKEAAMADFTKAVQLEPKFFVAIINLGYMQMEMEQVSAAEASFSSAIALQSENPSVYGLRANARMRQGNSTAAISDYQKAVELFPRNPLAHADLGFANFFLKKYDEAFKNFDQAININGKLRFLDPWIYASLVLSAQVQDANNRFAGTLAKPNEERDWIDLLTLYLMGKVSEEALLASVNKEDENAGLAQKCEGHYFIGLRQSNLTGPTEAKPHFEQCLETGASHLSAFRAAQFELQKFIR